MFTTRRWMPFVTRQFQASLHSSKWIGLAAAVGLIAGVGGIAFQVIEQTVFHFATERFAGYSPQEAEGEPRLYEAPVAEFSAAKLLLVLAAGGLVSGVLVYRFAPEAEGHGTDAAIDAFHMKRGYIRPIVPLVKLFASAITIGTSGSGGREGPIAQIGAGFGSYLATALKLPARERRILLAVGMGAGIGAIFRAPLAGALFAAEILYQGSDLESDVIVPAAVASTISYSVFSFWLPEEIRFLPLFGNQLQYRLNSVFELVPLTLLAFILVGVAVIYIKSFYGTHELFKRLPLPKFLKPTVGALLAGLIALGLFQIYGEDFRVLAVLGTGYGTLQDALLNPQNVGIGLLLTVAIFKIATTSATIGSGGSGGVFGPSMVIGGCTGGAVGQAFHYLAPTLAPNPSVYAIVGMAGFFAGAAHAPISTIVMVTELTGDYALLVPTMWVAMICSVLCQRWTLYRKQLPTRLDSPAHRGDLLVDILEGIKVSEVGWLSRKTVAESLQLREILRLLSESKQHYFPVLDSEQRFVGVFSTDDVRSFIFDESLWELANARDIMTTRVVAVSPDDDLNTALRRFTELNLDEMPVLSVGDNSKYLGMLRRRDVIHFYNQKLQQHQAEKTA